MCGHADIVALQNYHRIVAAAPDLQRASYYRETDFPHHGATVKLLLLLKPTEASYPSLQALLQCREVTISLVSGVARAFMQGRHARWYL